MASEKDLKKLEKEIYSKMAKIKSGSLLPKDSGIAGSYSSIMQLEFQKYKTQIMSLSHLYSSGLLNYLQMKNIYRTIIKNTHILDQADPDIHS
jgi:hypothetical protein